jgi:hypothetical protein
VSNWLCIFVNLSLIISLQGLHLRFAFLVISEKSLEAKLKLKSTFPILEIHIWEVIIDLVTVTLCLKLIEPLWDQLQIMTFFAVVNFSVAVLSSLYYLLLYAITKNVEILFEVKIHGLIGFLAGLCVAIMAIMPNLLIARTPFGNFTNR